MFEIVKGTKEEIIKNAIDKLNEAFEALEVPVHAVCEEFDTFSKNSFEFKVQIYSGNKKLTCFYFEYWFNALVNIKNINHKSIGSTLFEAVRSVYCIYDYKSNKEAI